MKETKTMSKMGWWLVACYILAGYAFPVLFRQRFMLLIFAFSFFLALSELQPKLRVQVLILAVITGLFFLRVLPLPYLSLQQLGFPVSIALAVSIFTVFVLSLLAILIGVRLYNKFAKVKV